MMEKDFFFIDEYNKKMVFHRKLFYDFICLCIELVFNSKAEMNSIHLNFLNFLNELESYQDVYFLTSELTEYWALCIFENNKSIHELSIEDSDKFSFLYKEFLSKNKIQDFVEKIN